VHLGRAAANVLAGCDWRFPSGVNLFSSVPAVLRGDAGAGLADLHGRAHRRRAFDVRRHNGADLEAEARYGPVMRQGVGRV
jgi:hypothetical protein